MERVRGTEMRKKRSRESPIEAHSGTRVELALDSENPAAHIGAAGSGLRTQGLTGLVGFSGFVGLAGLAGFSGLVGVLPELPLPAVATARSTAAVS